LQRLDPLLNYRPKMHHPTALISSEAQIHPEASIGAYVVIDGPVCVAKGAVIDPHAQLVGDTVIGEGTRVGRGAVIGDLPQDLGFDPATQSGVRIGKNNVIREHVTIHRGSKPGSLTVLGDGNFIMEGAHFGHDVCIGDTNVIANDVLLAGYVQVGHHTFLGGGAVFHQFIRIGDYCVVQGNGSFSKDIPHYCAAQRTNRVTGLNVIGLRRAGFKTEERNALKELFDLVFRGGMNLAQAIVSARGKSWNSPASRLLEFLELPSKKGVCQLRSRGAEPDEE
jgi:UDP-N-acetylglucosamine acyltransferase